MPAGTMPHQPSQKQADPVKRYLRQNIRQNYLLMSSARLDSALASDSPFVERLVHFWANHFAVSVDKLPVIGLAGLLEFEAIRPHVLGRFADMLLAVEQHPAMLVYLDQAQSIGPNSRAGQFAAMRGGKARGLNENLAREIMELHTLGVRTGYSQADVTEFARALTGWTVGGIGRGPAARDARQRAGRRLPVRRACSMSPATARSWASATAMAAKHRRARSDGPCRKPDDGEASRDQACAPFRRRRPADRPRRPAEQGLSRQQRRPPHTLSNADRIARSRGPRSRSSSRRRGNGAYPRCAPSGRATFPLRPRRNC